MTRIALNAAVCWAAAIAVAVASAGIVSVCGLGHDARELLGFGFDGVPRSPEEALRIAAHNGSMAALALIAAAIVSNVTTPARAFLDSSLATLLIVNAAAVGITVDAYGGRALNTLAPHAPIEFAALALGGGAYMHARTQALTIRAFAVAALLCASLLATAAVLETYTSNPAATR